MRMCPFGIKELFEIINLILNIFICTLPKKCNTVKDKIIVLKIDVTLIIVAVYDNKFRSNETHMSQ